MKTEMKFSPKQMRVMSWWHKDSKDSSFDGIICDGSVRSGKTVSMSLSFVVWALSNFNGERFAICGKTITSVKRNIAFPLANTLRSFRINVREKFSENYMEFSSGGVSNRIYFFGGKDESSSALIQGMTLAGVLFDEVALMPESFVSQALARCSVQGARFWFNCNPETPGHWFYTEWIKKKEEKNLLYLHFSMDDNPGLSDSVKKRYEKLYHGSFYDRYIRGLWVATSGLVYPGGAKGEFTARLPEEEAERYVISIDYGTVNPFSAGLWSLRNNIWFREAEFYYSSKKEGEQMTDEEYYNAVKNLSSGKNIDKIVIDPSAASFIATIRRKGEFDVVKAKNDVALGIAKAQRMFSGGKVKISPDCKDTLREFTLYRWDESGHKDSVVKENDHAMDDIRYFVSTVIEEDEARDDLLFFGVSRA